MAALGRGHPACPRLGSLLLKGLFSQSVDLGNVEHRVGPERRDGLLVVVIADVDPDEINGNSRLRI